jgi:hypothetical protein
VSLAAPARNRRGPLALRSYVSYPPPTGASAALAWTGLALSVAAPVAVQLAVGPLSIGPLATCLLLVAFASFGPGAALLCHVRLGSAIASWAMALVISLSIFGLSAAVLVWAHWWHPKWVLFGLCLVSVASALSCLAPALLGVPVDAEQESAPAFEPDARRNRMDGLPPGGRGPDHTMLIQAVPWLRNGPTEPDVASSDTMIMPRVTGGMPDRAVLPGTPLSLDSTAIIPRMVLADVPPDTVTALDRPRPAAGPVRPRASWRLWVQIGILFAGAACWSAAVMLSSTAQVSDYGLLGAVHPAFFAAVGLCVLGFVLEIGRGARRGWLLLLHLLLLLLILHATVPLLVPEPEYAWTYKHIGVIELFRSRGHVLDPTDIYQAWPSLFAGVAQLVTLSGASALKVAAWAPVYFDTANCLPLFAIVRSLTDDRRMPWLTVFLFTCVNWVAQDYLSPQAFTYVLCLGAVLIMLRWLRRVPGPANVWPRWLGRLWGWLHKGLAEVPYPSRRLSRTALISLYLVYAVVVISHQLSPYIVALSATALVLLGLVRSWQIIPILLGIAVLYLLPHYGIVDHYGLFDGFNIFSTFFHSTQGVSVVAPVNTAGRVFSVQAVQLLSVVTWGTAALAVLTARQRLGPVAAPATLAFAPFAVMFGQGYGGEAIYRVFLFSVPWCAYLIVTLFLRLRLTRVPRTVKVLTATAVLTAATLAGVQGAHGQLAFDQFTPAEVRSMEYLYAHVPDNATILSAAPNLPARLTANYGDFNGGADPESITTIFPALNPTITSSDLASIRAYCAQYDGPVYLVYMDSMATYMHYFGYLPDGTLESLRTALSTSPDWSVLLRDGDTVIYKFARSS